MDCRFRQRVCGIYLEKLVPIIVGKVKGGEGGGGGGENDSSKENDDKLNNALD